MTKPTETSYQCAACGKTFTSTRSEEEAEQELEETFGMAKEDCAIVCDACWKEMGFDE